MAIGRYRLNTKVILTAGTASTPVPGSPGTGGPDGFGNASTTGGPLWPTTYLQGMELLLDSAGALYAAIGAGNLTLITSADDVGHSGLSN